jgi:lipopolysaccharide export system protein LptA
MRIVSCLLGICLGALPALSGTDCAAAAPIAADRSVPTRITADGMTYAADSGQVTFSRSVHVVRPDFEMWADTLIVYLKPVKRQEEPAGGGAVSGMAAGDIDRIVAVGNVRMQKEKNSSTSGKATYVTDTGILTLEGSPRLTDGENVIAGEVVRYYMRENRSDVSGKVEAVFSTSARPTREGKP